MSNINTPTDKNDGSLAEEIEISIEKDSDEEIVEAVNDVAQESKITDQKDDEIKIITSNIEEKKSDNHDEDDFSVEVAVNEEELVNLN